jgi:hypothetical protein
VAKLPYTFTICPPNDAPKLFTAASTEMLLLVKQSADEYVSESFGVHRDVGDEMKKHFGIGEKNDTDTGRNG